MLRRYDCIYHNLRSRGEMSAIHNCITRFAPSPTGRLHLGHAWSALQAHDLARASGGQFLLRIEDIDAGRCRAEFVDGIFEDMSWLGLNWDIEPIFQSTRTRFYDHALEKLQALGLVYRCWCTRAEIAASAAAPQGEDMVLYPGTCKGRAEPDDGRPHCWRIDMAGAVRIAGPLDWQDSLVGAVNADPQMHGDVVIARKDAATSYHLAVTVDDAAQSVTDVVRGRDLFAATHIHRLLQALLGLPTPRYHHHPLIVDAGGTRLAKRRQSPSIAALRELGLSPNDVVSGLRAGRFPVGFALEQA
jgi:glutamyl-Q tRNA(Asp) synthetase